MLTIPRRHGAEDVAQESYWSHFQEVTMTSDTHGAAEGAPTYTFHVIMQAILEPGGMLDLFWGFTAKYLPLDTGKVAERAEETGPELDPALAELADGVLTATSPEDLADRLDAASCDERFWASIEKAELADKGAPKRRASSPAAVRAALGDVAAARYQTGLAAAEHLAELSARLPKRRKQEKATEKPYKNLGEMLYDVKMPLLVREGIAFAVRGGIAVLAVERAAKRKVKLAPAVAFALADTCTRFAESVRDLGEALITDPASVGEKWSPLLAEGLVDAARLHNAFEHWRQAAEAQEDGIYFPLGDEAL
jgi:hypothetical protein